jgi:hypothetical protein
MKKQKFKLPNKLALAILAVIIAVSFAIGYIWKFLTTSSYFRVTEIVCPEADVSRLNYLKGRNIFALDLKRESWKVLLGCSDCSNVRISRVLPNRLFINYIKRQPVAFVKFYKYFALDPSGVLFLAQPGFPTDDLPVIYGLETKIFAPRQGLRYNTKEVRLALSIIREFKASRLLKNFQLKRIDLADAENASVFILLPRPLTLEPVNGFTSPAWGGFEVKMGDSNIKNKVVILGGLILQAKRDLLNIKYMDLRFKEPVIKLKNAK